MMSVLSVSCIPTAVSLRPTQASIFVCTAPAYCVSTGPNGKIILNAFEGSKFYRWGWEDDGTHSCHVKDFADHSDSLFCAYRAPLNKVGFVTSPTVTLRLSFVTK